MPSYSAASPEWSANPARLAKRLTHEGKLRQAAQGLFYAPLPTRFGPAPPDETEILRAFLPYHAGRGVQLDQIVVIQARVEFVKDQKPLPDGATPNLEHVRDYATTRQQHHYAAVH